MTNTLESLNEAYQLLAENVEKPALLLAQAEELENYATQFEAYGNYDKALECRIGAQQSREVASGMKIAEQNLINAIEALRIEIRFKLEQLN